MAQKLILPLNNMRTTATYKHKDYKYAGKYAVHYGLDCSDRDRKDFQFHVNWKIKTQVPHMNAFSMKLVKRKLKVVRPQ